MEGQSIIQALLLVKVGLENVAVYYVSISLIPDGCVSLLGLP